MEKRYSTSYRLLFDWGRETNWLSCSHAFEMRITQTTWLFKAENFPPTLPPFSQRARENVSFILCFFFFPYQLCFFGEKLLRAIVPLLRS
jgi:hypothetical protein